ncbi:MAG: 50S ribosomal protein L11 methyltransferase [Alphaproteobacteria bacterium]|nr:50S ribosomal protein L11 methyltransferase [Alphaproteobacteria bacterium]
MSRRANPFAQSAECWELSFAAPLDAVIALEDAFADIALATSSFEQPHNHAQWTVQILSDHPPRDVAERTRPVEKALGIALSAPKLTRLRPEDWQPQLARDFPPLRVEGFYVHGAHARASCPPHLHSVQVEAGMAFGSGEHATTSLCLQALHRLAACSQPARVLDMGCGSGILAIAAARLWPNAVIVAVDVDAVSARIARDNMKINGVRVRTLAGDGYRLRQVREHAPYDIIMANILARPLVQLSRELKCHLRHGGVAILSGLLQSQKGMVLAAHRRQGLRLKQALTRQGWCALVLEG